MTEHKIASPVGFFEQIIPSELVDLMVKEVSLIKPEDYSESTIGTYGEHKTQTNTRNSKVCWWYEQHWVTSIFSHYFNKANRDLWEYDLNYLNGVQVTKYEENNHYTWHCDYGTSDDERYTRKLSATLVISDPSEYEGGNLEFINYHGSTVTVPNTKGTMIIFDSRTPHRVTPVTKGTRVSLVAWMLGPKLR